MSKRTLLTGLAAALIAGVALGGSVVALIDIGVTLGELRCRLAPLDAADGAEGVS